MPGTPCGARVRLAMALFVIVANIMIIRVYNARAHDYDRLGTMPRTVTTKAIVNGIVAKSWP